MPLKVFILALILSQASLALNFQPVRMEYGVIEPPAELLGPVYKSKAHIDYLGCLYRFTKNSPKKTFDNYVNWLANNASLKLDKKTIIHNEAIHFNELIGKASQEYLSLLIVGRPPSFGPISTGPSVISPTIELNNAKDKGQAIYFSLIWKFIKYSSKISLKISFDEYINWLKTITTGNLSKETITANEAIHFNKLEENSQDYLRALIPGRPSTKVATFAKEVPAIIEGESSVGKVPSIVSTKTITEVAPLMLETETAQEMASSLIEPVTLIEEVQPSKTRPLAEEHQKVEQEVALPKHSVEQLQLLNWVQELEESQYSPGASLLLPETAPAVAFVFGHALLDGKEKYSIPTMLHICQEAERTKQRPFVIFPGGDAPKYVESLLYRAIESDVTLMGISGAVQRCKESILIAPVRRAFSWMQDHFISLFDPEQGIALKMLGGYTIYETFDDDAIDYHLKQNFHHNLLKPLLEIAESNNLVKITISTDVIQPEQRKPFYRAESGSYGGNDIGLTSGILLTGDNQKEDISAFFGLDKAHQLRIPVSWLHVGHVDEIIAVLKELPATSNKRKQVLLAVASPRKALALLKKSTEMFTNSGHGVPGHVIKAIFEEMIRFENNGENGSSTLFDTLYFNTIANSDVYAKAFHLDSPLRQYNDDIQIKLDEAQKLISEYLSEHCDCEVQFIEVPALYYNQGKASSIFPPVANLLLTGKRVIYSKQYNKTFDEYIIKKFANLDLLPAPIDSNILHQLDGGLHCNIKALRISGKLPGSRSK